MHQSLRTVVPITRAPSSLLWKPSFKLLSVGSCFTEEIGSRLKACKFNLLTNPLGIIYNPISLLKTIQRAHEQVPFTADEIKTLDEEQFFCLQAHSKFTTFSEESCLKLLNASLEKTSRMLENLDVLMITLGSSWVYSLRETGEIVANCHKIPSTSFDKRLLTVEEIVTSWQTFLGYFLSQNPKTSVIFTVSAVRHTRDGFVENQVSKARLLDSVWTLRRLLDKDFGDRIDYFPAYELLHDDLRDYRFYAKDMVHPAEIGVDYIWDAFKKRYFEEETCTFVDEMEKVSKACEHRPFNYQSQKHQNFVRNTLAKLDRLEETYLIKFDDERKLLNNQLVN